MSSSDFMRLHITPLDKELISIVLSSTLLPKARNISYHGLDTFPERRYGFLDLPEEDAEKLRKKFNGATLRGAKMKVEKAREEKTRHEAEPENGRVGHKRKSKSHNEGESGSKKRKRDQSVVDGVILKERKVRRGWTETPTKTREKKQEKEAKRSKDHKDGEEKKKKKKDKQMPKSKYTNEEECLLTIKLPPDAVQNLTSEDAEKMRKKKKKKGKEREYIVHEFDKTTSFPSFLKSSAVEGGPPATEYVEGKGWIDENGNVVETVKPSKRPKEAKKTKTVKKADAPIQNESANEDGPSSDTSSSGSDSSSDAESEDEQVIKSEAASRSTRKVKEDDNSSESSTSSASSKESPAEEPVALPQGTKEVQTSPSSAKPLSIAIPSVTSPSEKAIHPLEALYKRQPPNSAAATTPIKSEAFSFFGGAEGSDIEEDEPLQSQPLQPPMTPFTKQDLDIRNIRSAAPTPDTAHPSRMQSFFSDIDTLAEANEDEEHEGGAAGNDDDDDGDNVRKSRNTTGGGEQEEESEFATWFWKNRKDLKSSYMRRKKDALKEKRHRDNKMRASKAI